MTNKSLAVYGLIVMGMFLNQPAHAQANFVNSMKSSTGGSLCLAVRDGRIANDSTLITWDCIAGDPSQVFYPQGGTMYRIGSPTSNFCIASYDNPAHNGSRVGVWTCQPGDPTQRFSPGANIDIGGPNNLCMGVTNASNVRGSPVILWDCQNRVNATSPNQEWHYSAVSAPAPATPTITYSPEPNILVFYYNNQVLGPNLLRGGYLISQDGSSLVAAQLDRNNVLVGGNGVPLTVTYKFISHNGSALVSSGAGNLVASGAGNLVAAGGGNLVAAGAGNLQPLAILGSLSIYDQRSITSAVSKLTSIPPISVVPQLAFGLNANKTVFYYNNQILGVNLLKGGYLISEDGSGLVAAHLDKNNVLVDSNGVPLTITYKVISHDGGSLVASGAGNLVASGAGNLVAAGAGNLLAAGVGNLQPLAIMGAMSIYDQRAIAPAVAKIVSTDASRIMINNGGNVITNNGGTYTLQATSGAPAQSSGPLKTTLTSPTTLVSDSANTITWTYTGAPTAAQSTIQIYLVTNTSGWNLLARNASLTARGVVVPKSHWTFANNPNYRCTLEFWDASGSNMLLRVPVTVR